MHEYISNSGHNSIVFFGRGSGKDPRIGVFKFSSNISVFLDVFLTRLTGLVGFFSYIPTLRVINRIKRFKPDIVHLHDLHGYFINIHMLVRFLKQESIKTIWTFHSEFMYTGKCGNSLNCKKWQTECNNCPLIREYPKSLFFDFTGFMHRRKNLLLSDWTNLTITTPSYWLKNRVLKSFLFNKRIEVIPNGMQEINQQKHSKIETKKKLNLGNKFVVLAVGSNLLTDIKGGNDFIDIASKVNDPSIQFIMIGTQKDRLKYLPKNLINISSIEDKSILNEYLRAADISILLSKSETFSYVTLESMFAGTPIIGYDSGAPKEIAGEGFGKFVPIGKKEEIISLILQFKQGKLNFQKEDTLQKYAMDNFSNAKMIKRYFDLYNDVISSI